MAALLLPHCQGKRVVYAGGAGFDLATLGAASLTLYDSSSSSSGADVLVVILRGAAAHDHNDHGTAATPPSLDLSAAVSAAVRPGGEVLLCAQGNASLDLLVAGLVDPVALGGAPDAGGAGARCEGFGRGLAESEASEEEEWGGAGGEETQSSNPGLLHTAGPSPVSFHLPPL